MNNKSIEQAAEEYVNELNHGLEITMEQKATDIGIFIMGAVKQKELSQEREKLLMGWITELRKYSRHNNSCDIIEYKDTCSCGFAILLASIEQTLKQINGGE